MEIVRWLLARPIVFAWILALLAILLNLGLSGEKHKGAEHGGKGDHAAMAEHSGKGDHQPAQAESAQDAQAAPAEVSAQATTAQAAPADANAQAATPAAQADANAQASASAQAVAPQGQAQAASGTASSADLLRAAREAYWSNDYDSSVAFYQDLLKQDDNPAYKGELANVFWKMGKSNEAAQLYINIGPWLLQQGRKAELVNMKVYIEMINPEQAKKIAALLGQ